MLRQRCSRCGFADGDGGSKRAAGGSDGRGLNDASSRTDLDGLGDQDSTDTAEPLATGNIAAGAEAKLGFQAETRQLLDIVTNPLYTDKEVFVRELVSTRRMH